jgi:hypothetical protein
MKRVALIICLLGAVVVGGFGLVRLSRQNSDEKWQPTSTPNRDTIGRAANVATVGAQQETTSPKIAYDLDEFKAALRRSSKTDLQAALQKFAPYFERHPESIEEIVAWLKNEENLSVLDAISTLREINTEHPSASGSSLIVRLALDIATNDGLPEKRVAALSQLSKVFDVKTEPMSRLVNISPQLIDAVAQLAETDADKRVRLAAMDAMGSWVDRNPNILPALSHKLLGIIKTSSDDELRAHGLQTVVDSARKHMGFRDDLIAEMTELSWTDPDERNRDLAAQGFSGASGKAIDAALIQLEAAYYQSTELDTKKIILHQMATIGKTNSIAILQRIPGGDPLARDVQTLMQSFGNEEGTVTSERN